MKTKPILLVIALLMALFFIGCSSIKVTHDYDRSVDFTQYKTFEYYGWAGESDKIINQLDRNRVEEAFGYEFARRGLTYVKSGGDLVVTLFFVVEDKTSTTMSTDHYGGYYGGYYGHGPGWGWGPSHSTTTVHEYDYQVGTLVVDVFDKKTESLIWESIGQGTIDDNPNNRDKNIPKAVAQIMEPFPVQPQED
jgi:hypothetical protein